MVLYIGKCLYNVIHNKGHNSRTCKGQGWIKEVSRGTNLGKGKGAANGN